VKFNCPVVWRGFFLQKHIITVFPIVASSDPRGPSFSQNFISSMSESFQSSRKTLCLTGPSVLPVLQFYKPQASGNGLSRRLGFHIDFNFPGPLILEKKIFFKKCSYVNMLKQFSFSRPRLPGTMILETWFCTMSDTSQVNLTFSGPVVLNKILIYPTLFLHFCNQSSPLCLIKLEFLLLKNCQCILHFRYYLPLKINDRLHLNKLESPSLKDASNKFWLKH
jgi:hypothetical protein